MSEVYRNPIATRLGLKRDDEKLEAKLLRLCEDVHGKILSPVAIDIDWSYCEDKMSSAEAMAADWSNWPVFTERTVWGQPQSNTWIAADITVPETAAGAIFLLKFSSNWVDRPGSTDPQGLVYLDGEIAQGLDGNHTEVVIERNAKPGNRHKILIDAFTFFDRLLVGLDAKAFLRNEELEHLYFDIKAPLDIAIRLHQNDTRRHRILALIERALNALDRRRTGKELDASIAGAKAIADEIYAMQDTEARPVVTAVGHTHIDVAWLWRVLHTREKSGRSFATVLNLMEEFPEFIFMYNQAVLFDYLKKDYPALWEGIQARVKSGQFEIEGAMWLEPDANIVSGESMIRQILLGRQFHQENFGVTPTCVWLPDTFGYSANMPQILDGCGLEHFVTSKISWNDTNLFPYDAFYWHGIDGTAIKARLITTQDYESEDIFTTYNSMLTATEVLGSWRRQEPKAASEDVLICYGHGDGGGGPTREMVQAGMRFARGIPGAPEVRLEGLGKFLERSSKTMTDDKDKFPAWHGELYLELHRGTLTTIAKNKANNRRAERKMRELEFFSSLAMSKGQPYPKDVLHDHWKTVLLNQFHDILPGTSIPEVYEDSDAEYASLFQDTSSTQGAWHNAARAAAGDDKLRLVNFTSQERHELITLGPDWKDKSLVVDGRAAPVQKINRADGSDRFATIAGPIPSMGWIGAVQSVIEPATQTLNIRKDLLENDLVCVRFDSAGEITSVFDKNRNRELIPTGAKANELIAYEDKPVNWDAWDIDHSFEHKFWKLSDLPCTIEVIEEGPHRAALKVTRQYQSSKVVQIISLAAHARQIEFDTFVDWREEHTVLKTGFQFDLNTTDIYSEIQFGHVKRATHRNTGWDKARFEASMHRWIAMQETDFGAALINDCKYAYDAHGQSIRLTLMRGPKWPDPEADQGEHLLRYALALHDGQIETVHDAAERFNNPVAVIGTPDESDPSQAFSFASTDAPNVTIETVKKAETGDDLIVRIFENANRRADATIVFGLPIAKASLVNMIEDYHKDLIVTDNSVSISLRPFEVATIKLTLKR